MLDISFANHGAQPLQSAGYYMYVGSAAPIHQRDLPLYTAFDWYVQGAQIHPHRRHLVRRATKSP